MRLSVEMIAERLLLTRGFGVGIDEHEIGAALLQFRDGPVGRFEGRHLRPLDEHTPEHVGDTHRYTGRLEEPQVETRVLFVEVGGTYHPVLISEELSVSSGVEGV